MTVIKVAVRCGCALLATVALGSSVASAQIGDARLTDAQLANRQEMAALGLKYKSAWTLFEALRKQAGGGQPISWKNMPDWTGIYGRTKGGTAFDPDGPPQGEYPDTAHFTPKFAADLHKAVNNRKNGIEYDPLSKCNPPTYPRWLDLPFMRDFIVTPAQTWMIAEAFNSIRRIYTDGRGHLSAEDRYPTETGDSIGFWDGDRLIVHTNSSKAHMYERAQGYYTDQVEGVEIWHKVDAKTLVANTWIYDPPALAEPWYTRQSYSKLDDNGKTIRINNWYCQGSPNNSVHETSNGGSQFSDFTWMKKDSSKNTGKDAAKEKLK